MLKRKSSGLALVGIMTTFMPPMAYAQETTEPVQEMDTIVVTAAGYEQDIVNAPASISVVTREELEKGSYKNLHDALRDVPGIILTPSDNNSKDISLRGMGADYTLLMVDGKRVSTRETQTNGSSGTDQSWMPPLAAIERIEVVRGPMSSLYGSDAMGGVVNVITRKVPEVWMGSIRFESTLQERSFSGNEFQSNFYLAGPIKNDLLGISLQGVYSHRSEDQRLGGYNRNRTQGGTVKLSLTPNRDHDIILEAGAYKQNFQSTPGKTLDETEAFSHRDFKRENYSLTHNGRWGFGTSTSYVQHEKTRNIARQMSIKNTTANSSWTVPLFDNHILTFGAHYNRQALDDFTTNRSPVSATPRTNIERWSYALFAENEWQMTDSFALTAGLRMDHDELFGTHWSPRIYGVWHLNDNWSLKGGVSTGFKAPKLRETIFEWGQTSRGGDIYGNPDLQPETSISKEIGLHYRNDYGLNASVTVYDNDYDDKITRIRCPSCGPANSRGNFPTTRVNVDKAITRGVEASISTPLSDSLRLNAGYTYTHSEQKSGEFKGNPLNQMPFHMANIGLNWQATEKINVWSKLSFRGAESATSGAASSGSTRNGSSTLLDLGGSYKVNKSVTLHAGIYNILDRRIDEDHGYDYVEDGRRYWLGVDARF